MPREQVASFVTWLAESADRDQSLRGMKIVNALRLTAVQDMCPGCVPKIFEFDSSATCRGPRRDIIRDRQA